LAGRPTIGDSMLASPTCREADAGRGAVAGVVAVAVAVVGAVELSVSALPPVGDEWLLVVRTVASDPEVVSIAVPPALATTASPAGIPLA
jgi:hypothetical protein